MTCTRCQGLVLERYGAYSCINCGHDPFLKLITVKCSNPDCFAMPELNGYCTPCWHSRKRSTLTEAQKAKMYREKQRRANAAKRAKRAQLKEAMREQLSPMLAITEAPAHQDATGNSGHDAERALLLL